MKSGTMPMTRSLTRLGSLPRSRWLDFVELTKPRIGVMVLFTVAIGALLANQVSLDLVQLVREQSGFQLTLPYPELPMMVNEAAEKVEDRRDKNGESFPLDCFR